MAMASFSQALHGVIPALPTPLTPKGDVDEAGLTRLVRFLVDQGVHGLWILGSSGEFTSFCYEERTLIIEITVKAAAGRVPVIAGVADNGFRQLVRNAEGAAQAGADACFILLPFYFVTDMREGVSFLREAARAAPLPVILYDNPAATKVKLEPSSYLELAGVPNIVALKDSSSDFVRFQNILVQLSERTPCKLFQGDERLIASSLLWGAHGTVAALANLDPSLFLKLYEAAKRGDIQGCLRQQKRLFTLCRLFEVKGGVTDGAFFAGLKAALEVMGICGRAVSPPFQPLPDEKMPEVEKLLRDCCVPLPG